MSENMIVAAEAMIRDGSMIITEIARRCISLPAALSYLMVGFYKFLSASIWRYLEADGRDHCDLPPWDDSVAAVCPPVERSRDFVW